MKKSTKKELVEINRFRSLFPKEIKVRIIPCEDGSRVSYTIRISEFPNAITEAENLDDLITMASDCVATVLRVPKKYLPFMPRYLPSMEIAQYMNAFPRLKIVRSGELSIKESCG
ncbi:MAG: hypothetical protein AAB577_02580 [Patescibacteria group bacterium]